MTNHNILTSPDLHQFVQLVISALEEAEIAYFIGGSLAVWAWGQPRSTLDLDVVISVPPDAIHRLSLALNKRGMLLPDDIIIDALVNQWRDVPLNVVSFPSGLKSDLYLLFPDDELRQSAFARRRLVDLGEGLGELWVSSAEDLIIYKIYYYNISKQSKHISDIGSILKFADPAPDFTYINDWLDRLGLLSAWAEILDSMPE